MKKLVFLQVIYGILTFSFLGLLILYFFTNLVDWYGWIGWLWTVFAGLMIGAGAKKNAIKSLIKFCWIAASQDKEMDTRESVYIQLLAKHFGLSEGELMKIAKEVNDGKEIELPESEADRKAILENVASIIKIDGKVTDKEREFLFAAAEKLKFSKSDAEALL